MITPDSQRMQALEQLKEYLENKIQGGEQAQLNFICTHNSRRSQFGQFWSYLLAHQLNLPIQSFSGGTEITSCNPRTIKCLEQQDFNFTALGPTENPRYQLTSIDSDNPLTMFSKLYDDQSNPTKRFAAIMTCSHADANCPFIPGADLRISLPFDDPGQWDGSSKEEEAYKKCSDQFYTELSSLYHSIASSK